VTVALDTNVIVRFLVRDEPAQAEASRALIEGATVRVVSTVMLETVWTLEKAYDQSREDIAAALTAFMGLPMVRVDDATAVRRALDLYADGLDFADALHLCLAAEADRFATFDRTFVRRAARLRRSEPVVGLP
jgi:predicted nucleic-acid-binding protein